MAQKEFKKASFAKIIFLLPCVLAHLISRWHVWWNFPLCFTFELEFISTVFVCVLLGLPNFFLVDCSENHFSWSLFIHRYCTAYILGGIFWTVNWVLSILHHPLGCVWPKIGSYQQWSSLILVGPCCRHYPIASSPWISFSSLSPGLTHHNHCVCLHSLLLLLSNVILWFNRLDCDVIIDFLFSPMDLYLICWSFDGTYRLWVSLLIFLTWFHIFIFHAYRPSSFIICFLK